MDRNRLIQTVKRHEGSRSKPYIDSVGKLTIGVGRNLDDVGLRDDEIDMLLDNDLRIAEADARQIIANFDSLDAVRQEVLVNMSFNLGRPRLSGFRRMIEAVVRFNFNHAAREMLDSRWAEQVGDRAQELAKAMRTGAW